MSETTYEVQVWRDVKVHYSYKVPADSEEEAILLIQAGYPHEHPYDDHQNQPTMMVVEYGDFDWNTVKTLKGKEN